MFPLIAGAGTEIIAGDLPDFGLPVVAYTGQALVNPSSLFLRTIVAGGQLKAAQLAAPTWRLRGQAILIESKDDVRKRLGASTDDADAVILAWHRREQALARGRPRRAAEINAFAGGWMA